MAECEDTRKRKRGEEDLIKTEDALALVAMHLPYAAPTLRVLSKVLAEHSAVAAAASNGALALRQSFEQADVDRQLVKWTQDDRLQDWEFDTTLWKPRMEAVSTEIAHALVSPFAYYRASWGEDPYGIFDETTSIFAVVADEVADEANEEEAERLVVAASGIAAASAGLPTPPCVDPLRDAVLHNPRAYMRLMAASRLVADMGGVRQAARRDIDRELLETQRRLDAERWEKYQQARAKATYAQARVTHLALVDRQMYNALHAGVVQLGQQQPPAPPAPPAPAAAAAAGGVAAAHPAQW
jgi:hypothetical protein